ncbi:hypothetical protein [Actinopolymorpha alba]|uniref:hypothetical protein n=1 Tax=Actinopolymorpha alba TaxID=533267 RepID=UPI0007C77E29|nr:hypothetical protein [Actinopolymorpha alba]
MQRALWGMVTPELRGVAVSWDRNYIKARFLYDMEDVDEDVEKIVSEVETEVLADFDKSLTTEFLAQATPMPIALRADDSEWWAYIRRE